MSRQRSGVLPHMKFACECAVRDAYSHTHAISLSLPPSLPPSSLSLSRALSLRLSRSLSLSLVRSRARDVLFGIRDCGRGSGVECPLDISYKIYQDVSVSSEPTLPRRYPRKLRRRA